MMPLDLRIRLAISRYPSMDAMTHLKRQSFNNLLLFGEVGTMVYRLVVRPFLRFLDSERTHGVSIKIGAGLASTMVGQKMLGSLYGTPSLPTEAFGMSFRHPVGLAAGMDKKCEALSLWPSVGFAWTEGGGVTYHAQDGNPKPRMFRSDSDNALINRMGFNNPGAVSIRKTLITTMESGGWPTTPLAVNVGCSKVAMGDARPSKDYIATMQQLWDLADMFVINVSSPNTAGLRELAEPDILDTLLREINEFKISQKDKKPILYKISPDESNDAIRLMVEIAIRNGIDGFVAVNTTVSRPKPTSTRSRRAFSEIGGLSGRPLHPRSLEVIRNVYNQVGSEYPIVGVGGIDSAESAWDAITNGATLLQIYSALVFSGPAVVKRIIRGLQKKMKQSGIENIQDAVGIHSNT